MLAAMPYTDDERRKIADTVRRARMEQELDKEPAARAAKVNSITWKRVEDSDAVRDASLSKILRSLGLPSADEILAGELGPSEDRSPKWVVDQSVDLSSAGLLHVLTLLWETWRDLAMDLAPTLDPEMSRQLRRAMLLTANATLDILELAAPISGVDELTADIMKTVTELLGNRSAVTPPEQDDHDRDSRGTAAGASEADDNHVLEADEP